LAGRGRSPRLAAAALPTLAAIRLHSVECDPGTGTQHERRPVRRALEEGCPRGSGVFRKDIEVLEGWSRPAPSGMYVGGTDEAALHHLAAETLDTPWTKRSPAMPTHRNAPRAGNFLTVRDNGRGIRSTAPEVQASLRARGLLTTLHSGGKFSGKVYTTSGGLHGVGASVVNALSDVLQVEVARDRTLFRQEYARGKPKTRLINAGPIKQPARHHDPLHPTRRFLPLCSSCRRASIDSAAPKPTCSAASNSLAMRSVIAEGRRGHAGGSGAPLSGRAARQPGGGCRHGGACRPAVGRRGGPARRRRWAEGRPGGMGPWPGWRTARASCIRTATPCPPSRGGTHEAGFRTALLKGLRAWGEHRSNRRAAAVTAEDVTGGMAAKLSAFIRDPQFRARPRRSSPVRRPRAWSRRRCAIGSTISSRRSDDRR